MTKKIQQLQQAIREVEIAKINNDYFIDTMGNVYNRPRFRINGGVMKVKITKDGYPSVRLLIDGKSTTHLVHRLLAKAFIPNPENKPQVNHIDSNRINCALENLEWCTASENVKHSYDYGAKGRVKSNTGEKYIYKSKHAESYLVRVKDGNMRDKALGSFRSLYDAIKVRDQYLNKSKQSTSCTV